MSGSDCVRVCLAVRTAGAFCAQRSLTVAAALPGHKPAVQVRCVYKLSLRQPKRGKTRTPVREDATLLIVCCRAQLCFQTVSRYMFAYVCGGSCPPSLRLWRVCVRWLCGCSLFVVHDRHQCPTGSVVVPQSELASSFREQLSKGRREGCAFDQVMVCQT